ncbi:MAG: hypothetical protein H6Q30_529 [Bacteroidetes bacterium]|nr:hypothetical protein [Bacteroidota bacterium]
MSEAHRVEQGESLYSIAKKHGFPNWRLIFDDPANTELKKKRPNPHVLQPGDIVQIPEVPKEPHLKVPLDGRTVITRTRQGFQPIRILLLGQDRLPRTNTEYTLKFQGGEVKGKTNGAGLVREEIPVDARELTLHVEDDRWVLRVGDLNPLTPDTNDQGVEGAKARLRNLGYFLADVNSDPNKEFKSALIKFQADQGLKKSGDLDDATRQALMARHGS